MNNTYDNLVIGDLITESAMNDGTVRSAAIGKVHDLKLRSDLTSQSIGVKNTGTNDISLVFEVVETYKQKTYENQTNKEQYSKILDSWGDAIGATIVDELMVAEKTRLVGGIFNGTTPDTNFYTTTLVGNGTANITNSVLNLATTIDSNSSAMVMTKSKARYYGGNMNQLRLVARIGDLGQTNNTRMIGVTEDSTLANSVYIQLNGTTFSIVAKTNGLPDIKIDNGQFNGDVSTFNLTTNFYTFEFLYTTKKIQIYVDGILLHTLIQTTNPICGTRHLRAFMKNTNTGIGSITNMYVESLTISTWGKNKTQPKYLLLEGLNAGILLKTGIGALHTINLSGVQNNANVTLYDGTSTAGIKIYTTGTMGAQTTPLNIIFNDGINFENGLFVTITGANCNAQIIYE